MLVDAILIPPFKEGKGSAKKVRKQVTKGLQIFYQSVGIHMKNVLLVFLLCLLKYLVLYSAKRFDHVPKRSFT